MTDLQKSSKIKQICAYFCVGSVQSLMLCSGLGSACMPRACRVHASHELMVKQHNRLFPLQKNANLQISGRIHTGKQKRQRIANGFLSVRKWAPGNTWDYRLAPKGGFIRQVWQFCVVFLSDPDAIAHLLLWGLLRAPLIEVPALTNHPVNRHNNAPNQVGRGAHVGDTESLRRGA